MSKANKDKGNRGEREWRDFLIEHGWEAIRKRDGLVDVSSNVSGVHWEVKRRENPRDMYSWIRQAERDALKLGAHPVVVFRKNYNPWRCIISAEFLMELLKIREEWLKDGG